MHKMLLLDSSSTLEDCEKKFSLHTKVPDSHLYLKPSSCHLPHTFRWIPIGLTTRRFCSVDEIFEEQSRLYLCNCAIDEIVTKKPQLNPFKTKYKCDRRPSVLKKQGAVIKWENRRFFSLKKKKTKKQLLFGYLEKNQNQKYYIFCFKHKDCKAKHN